MKEKEKLQKSVSEFLGVPVEILTASFGAENNSDSAPLITFEIECVPDFAVEDNAEEEIPFCDMDCSDCCACDNLDGYDIDEYYEPPLWGIPDIRRIIFNPPATIVFWADGTKTVVKCIADQPFERYAGFAAACMKKMFGSTSRAKKVMEECDESKPAPAEEKHAAEAPKQKKKSPENPVFVNNIKFDDIFDMLFGLNMSQPKKEKKDETSAE